MVNKKVSGAADYIIPLAVVGGIGILAYFLVTKLGGLLTTSNSQNNKQTTDANASASAASQAQASAAGINPTLTPNQMAAIANQVYTLGTTGSDPSALTQINNQLTQVNNIADLNGIIAAFGTKEIATSSSLLNSCYALGFNCTAVGLSAFVDLVYQALDSTGGYLETLNEFLSAQNINFQF
jgi:hypothetical protein